MIDEKDIEIAKLRGQVEALEKMLKTVIALQPVAPVPQFIPVPMPTVVPQPWPFDPGPTWRAVGPNVDGSMCIALNPNNGAACNPLAHMTQFTFPGGPGFGAS